MEIRVKPSDRWDSGDVRVQFLLIFAPEDERFSTPEEIENMLKFELGKLPWANDFKLEGKFIRIGDYDDFTYRDCIESYPLDINALSFSTKRSK